MAHRNVITAIVVQTGGGTLKRVLSQQMHLKNRCYGRPLKQTIIIATRLGKPKCSRTVKPLSAIMGINVLYTSTPEGLMPLIWPICPVG